MKESTKLLIRVLTGFELADRWIAFCSGTSADELRRRRKEHPVAHNIGIAIVILAVVVTVVIQFLARHH
jgi:hypothetical protein